MKTVVKAAKKFEVHWFDDYHEIDYFADKCKMKGAEVGAFFRKGKTRPGQLVYWGVFWKNGRKPLKADILKALRPLVEETEEFPLV